MNAMELLSTRRSVSKLVDPAPDDATLERVLGASLRAPDHGAVRPWRIVIVKGAERAALGELLASSERSRDPAIDEAKLDATRKKALRAPMILVVACTPKAHPKVPEIKQVLSTGCVAHGILLGLQAEGFGAVWKTGPAAYDFEVKTRLGLAGTDHIVGFLYVGTAAVEPPELHRPSSSDHVRVWGG